MSKSNIHETAYLSLMFQNQAMANIGDAAGIQPSAGAGSFYVALFKSDPGEGATGLEADYTGYARVAVARSAVGWDVTGNVASNVSEIIWPTSSGVDNTITHFAIYTASTGGDMIGSGALSGAVTINNGDTPKAAVGQIQVTEN